MAATALFFLIRSGAPRTPSEEAHLADAPRPPAASRPPVIPVRASPRPEASTAAPDADRDRWQKRLARAQQALDAYLQATRYPHGSRPIAEQPDQMKPHHVAPVSLPLARGDRKLTDAKLTLGQDRLFLVGDDRVTLSIACTTSEGPAPCEVQRAMATVPPDMVGDAGAPPAVPVTFSASDGSTRRAVFQPSAEGFAGYHGPIHVDLALAVAGEAGGASFEVVYTPAAPAVFTGRVREALEQGSLVLSVEMDVAEPGRYVLAARVDDADGRPFAYLSFNDELVAGRQEARLTIFGKLVRDEGARSPFRLRDLEGFRLIPDAYPDRALMPGIDGVMYTTRAYTLGDFSDAAWQSEEKDRYVQALTKDVDEAKQHAGGL